MAMEWRHTALCVDENPELWFPVGTTGTATVDADVAKSICHRCAVSRSCLEHAEEIGATDGIWGGLDTEERRGLKARARSRTAR
jgi:WhiB family redox-sensing transcriptional regulator